MVPAGSGGRLPAVPSASLSPVRAAAFGTAVLDWYAVHGRPLNFRRRWDPYAVLVSETMAQQTQISRVEPAWDAFLARFPSVDALAAASAADVLRAWQGLGYNRRALNLQRAARAVTQEYGGVFPDRIEVLQRLPGVGPYTARAIAAIAFGQPVGPVDTNVRRVLGRVVGGWVGLAPRVLQDLADDLVPPDRPGAWTQALMDIGATFCRPRRPRCGECPARTWCAAAAAGGPPASPPGPPAVAGARARAVPFRLTSRWLRGRLVDRARSAAGDGWMRVDEGIEPHDPDATAVAARSLAREGLLEHHPTDAALVRLPR